MCGEGIARQLLSIDLKYLEVTTKKVAMLFGQDIRCAAENGTTGDGAVRCIDDIADMHQVGDQGQRTVQFFDQSFE